MGRPTARFGAVGIFLEKVEKRVYIASMSLRLVVILRPKIASVLRQARIATRAQLQRDSRKPSLAAGASACTPSTSRHRYVAAALASYLLPTRERTAHADARAAGSLSSRLMIYKLLYRIPGGHAVQVFTGVCLVLGIGCAPVLYKKTRAGHDYFSSEKPEAVERGLEAKQKEKYADIIKRNG